MYTKHTPKISSSSVYGNTYAREVYGTRPLAETTHPYNDIDTYKLERPILHESFHLGRYNNVNVNETN